MITKDNTLKVMEVFFREPEGRFHLRQLARLTRLSMPGVRKIVKKLEREGLVSSKREKVVRNVYATRNGKFIFLKRAHNLYSVYLSGLLDLLKDFYEEPEAIILFGSYSRGEDVSKSDIDIAVVTPKQKSPDVSKFEHMLGRKIVLYEISLKKAEPEFINALANGIVLYGYLKVLQ